CEFLLFCVSRSVACRALHSFPTRRSSDLEVLLMRLSCTTIRYMQLVCTTLGLLQMVLYTTSRQLARRFSLLTRLRLTHGYQHHRSEEHTPELQSRENLV